MFSIARGVSSSVQRVSSVLLNAPRETGLIRRNFYAQYRNLPNSPIWRRLVLFPLKFVPQQHEVLRERFGKFVQKLGPGLQTAIPVVDTLVYVRMTENVYAVTKQRAITKDNASAEVDAVIYYIITDSEKAAYKINHLLDAVLNLVITNLRALMGDMPLDELLSGRKKINEKLLEIIEPAAAPWGVKITRIEIKSIEPDEKLVVAMDQQMIAERQRRAEILKAEATKGAVVLVAEGNRTKSIVGAEGDKGAAVLAAEARLEVSRRDAEARLVLAEAEAKALKMVADVIKENPAVVNFTIAKKTAEAWGTLAASPSGSRVLFFPTGASSIVTPLAAAAEIVRGTIEDSQPPKVGFFNQPGHKLEQAKAAPAPSDGPVHKP